MLRSLADKTRVYHDGFDKTYTECVVFGMINLGVPMCPAAEARKSRLKFGADGSVDHFHGERPEDNGWEVLRHPAKIPTILVLHHRNAIR
jgi:hypothetical protein